MGGFRDRFLLESLLLIITNITIVIIIIVLLVIIGITIVIVIITMCLSIYLFIYRGMFRVKYSDGEFSKIADAYGYCAFL